MGWADAAKTLLTVVGLFLTVCAVYWLIVVIVKSDRPKEPRRRTFHDDLRDDLDRTSED